ncbi:MAG: hypothetical protein DWQ07_07130 [Chloroflexi bacterium]|nr:MAG: hypothetical protein DWQ07_07130 [Chloroflexota bacterium]MBL1195525.1 hypothetical protein [Chloroflexota bacterium]NOH12807.1 hypothetical protein [Chloroflexota bacterium]
MSQAFKLYRLQQVDTQLDKAHTRLKEIEAALQEDAAQRKAEADLEASQNAHEEAQKLLKGAEQDVQAQQIKIEQNQARLYSGKVTNPKELQDLEQEAEALKRYLAELEEVQLEKMIAFEEATTQQEDAGQTLESVRADVASQNSALTTEQNSLEAETGRLQEERTAALDGVPAEDVALYESLREQRAGLAIVKVDNMICSACGTTLSQALAQAARSPNKLSRCSTCKRILYAG